MKMMSMIGWCGEMTNAVRSMRTKPLWKPPGGKIIQNIPVNDFHVDLSQVSAEKMRGIRFERCDISLDESDTQQLEIYDCNFIQCTFFEIGAIPRLQLKSIEFGRCLFLDDINVRHVERAGFIDCTFSRRGTEKRRIVFSGETLVDATFVECGLKFCEFRGITVSGDIRFNRCRTDGMVVEKSFMRSLGSGFAGLTHSQLEHITIVDPVTDIRAGFSGIMRLVHATALILLLAPYVKFFVELYLRAKFDGGDGESVFVLTALCRYVLSGGLQWRDGWFFNPTCLLLVFGLVFNGLRLSIYRKILAHETEEKLLGIPREFKVSESLQRRLDSVAWMTKAQYWIVGLHTLYFLFQSVPIGVIE